MDFHPDPRAVCGEDGGVLHDIAPGVRRMTLPLSLSAPDHIHCFLLDMPGGTSLLVDTGMRGSEAALRAGLEAAGSAPDRVLITHGHIDHWGLASTITHEVLAHPTTASSLDFSYQRDNVFGEHDDGIIEPETVAAAFRAFRTLSVGEPPRVRAIDDGDTIGDWKVVWTPGHDPGHICLFREADGVLLCGDALLPDNTPNIQPAAGRPDALGDFFASLDRLSGLPVTLVLPSHGEPYVDHVGRAAALRAFHQRRLERIVAELGRAPRTVGELSRVIFPVREGPVDDMLADMETLAHLDHLRLDAKAQRGDDHRWSEAAAA